MTKKDEQIIERLEGLLVKAVQAGKQETSGLVGDILNRIEPSIEKSIEKHVNGKIRNLDSKLSEYIVSDNKWKDETKIDIKENTEYRLTAKGSVNTIKFIVGFLGFANILLALKMFLK